MKGPLVNSYRQDRRSISAPEQASDYVWYALQRRALSYLLAQKEVDADRIGAKGYSYGGTTMWNLGMDPRGKAIVAYFGIGWLEYYRTNSVWMYNRPYREPKKTPGQELYLSAVAPQAHVPYITAASLWLNGSNDHHGGHERGCETLRCSSRACRGILPFRHAGTIIPRNWAKTPRDNFLKCYPAVMDMRGHANGKHPYSTMALPVQSQV